MEHKSIAVKLIDPNPHRNFKRNPLRMDQVEKVQDSIGRTGFWDNIVVREHPDGNGRYQLAYGHNRIEAVKRAGIKTITIPVAPLGEYDMLTAMIDENETQQLVNPIMAFENILASVELLERALKAIGPKGTEEDLYRAMEKTYVRRRTHLNDGTFERTREAYFTGEGLGRVFVMEHCPSARLHGNTVAEVLSSHFGEQRAAAKELQAEEESAKAERATSDAAIATDPAGEERKAKEAAAANAKAEELRQEAKRIGAGTISAEILQSFQTVTQMEGFASAIKKLNIPKSKHKKAADFSIDEGLSSHKMKEKLESWWYVESGQQHRDYQRIMKKEADDEFRRHCKDGNFKTYLFMLREDARKLKKNMDFAIPTAPYFEDEVLREAACKDLNDLIETAKVLVKTLTKAPVVVLHNGALPQIAQE